MNLYKVKINIEEMDSPLKEIEDMIECNDEFSAEILMLDKYRDIIKEYHYCCSVSACQQS